jgi:hypothetical protein
MQSVEASLRRPIQVECPACGGISIGRAAAGGVLRAGGNGDGGRRELLEPLLIDSQPVMVLARALNAALRVDGYPLPVRLREEQGAAPSEPPPERATVH